MDIKTFDDEAFAVDAESYFYLWCCDCKLRHLVVIDTIGKKAQEFKDSGGKILIGMTRDDHPTNLERKNDGIVLYRKKKK